MKLARGVKDQSESVGHLQQLLKANGFDAGPSDGIFGTLTERALKQFEVSMGYPPDGIATEIEFDALKRNQKMTDKMRKQRADSHIPASAPALTAAAIKILLQMAQSEIGHEEHPLGSNRGPDIDKYTKSWAVPWCAAFVSWAFNNAPFMADPIRKTAKVIDPYIYAVVKFKDLLVKSGTYNDAKSPGRPPAAGDVFIILYSGADGVDTGHGHTGLIVNYDEKSNAVYTVEGNTANGVRSKIRPISSLSGWGNILLPAGSISG